MAAKIGGVKGSYKESVEDSGKGQSSKKFGGYAGAGSIKDSGKHSYNQKSNPSKDSGK